LTLKKIRRGISHKTPLPEPKRAKRAHDTSHAILANQGH
jgi:hypothetical protein